MNEWCFTANDYSGQNHCDIGTLFAWFCSSKREMGFQASFHLSCPKKYKFDRYFIEEGVLFGIYVWVCVYIKLNDLQLNHCNSLQIPRHLTFHCEENNKFGETTYKSGCFAYLLAVKLLSTILVLACTCLLHRSYLCL